MMACAWLSIFSTTPPPRILDRFNMRPLTSLALLFFGLRYGCLVIPSFVVVLMFFTHCLLV